MVRISSWNILTSKFCNASSYPNAPTNLFDNYQRAFMITERLLERTRIDDVICMQEVCRHNVPMIQAMFIANNFSFIWEPYGPHNMGSALAIRNDFVIYNIKFINVSSTCKNWPTDKIDTSIRGYCKRFFDYVCSFFTNKTIYPPFWTAMKTKKNSMICATVGDGTTRYAVGSYHMPCHYGSLEAEQQMCGFMKLTLNAIHEYANGLPYILGIDANTKPCDAAYELATTGNITDKTKDISLSNWSNRIHKPVNSLYKNHFGEEPIFTNKSRGRSGDFCGTLDYIFMSNEWDVINAETLNDHGYMPNLIEPSDHLLIAGYLAIA